MESEEDAFREKKTRLLVIEDDPDDVYLLRRMLESDHRRNYELQHYTSVDSALDAVARIDVDVILLDLGLSNTQGLSTLNHLLSVVSDIPVVVFTGANDEEIGELAVKAGAEDFVPKGEATAGILSRSITYAIDRHALLRKLKDQAIKDPLTGLPNRTALFDRLEILFNNMERNDGHLALAMLDLDGFKQVNDSYGHRVGDDMLSHISARLQKQLRRSDMAVRLGGDEFVLLLTNYSDRGELVDVINKKRAVLVEPLTLDTPSGITKFDMSVSIGVAEWEVGVSPENLLSIADEAMYIGKHNGKNTIHYAK